MCIYCGTDKYRKIYEHHRGVIPREADGRTYEVHHIDGNHDNHHPDNLTAITLQEHYDIHYTQGDLYACMLMAWQRMNKTPEEISKLARLHVKKQLINGTHPGQKKSDGSCNAIKQLNRGTHPFQTRSDGTSLSSDRVKNGTHPLLKRSDGTSLSSDRINNSSYVNPFSKRSDGSSVSSDKVKNGTHHLLGKDHSAKNSPSYDHTVYTLKHKISEEIIQITQYDFAKKYNLNKGNVNAMIKGKKRSCGGWSLVS